MILETILLAGMIVGGAKYWTREAAQEKKRKRKVPQKNIKQHKTEKEIANNVSLLQNDHSYGG